RSPRRGAAARPSHDGSPPTARGGADGRPPLLPRSGPGRVRPGPRSACTCGSSSRLDRYFCIAASTDPVHRKSDVIDPQLNTGPGSRKQDEESQLPATQILLVLQVLVRRNQQFVGLLLRGVE